jgi:hypothetical protein
MLLTLGKTEMNSWASESGAEVDVAAAEGMDNRGGRVIGKGQWAAKTIVAVALSWTWSAPDDS